MHNLEKQGKLHEAKHMLQQVLAAHREGNTIGRVMTAGKLERVLTKLYPTRDDLPTPGTSDYKKLNEQIKIIRQIVNSSESVALETFEILVGNLDRFNQLIKTAADN